MSRTFSLFVVVTAVRCGAPVATPTAPSAETLASASTDPMFQPVTNASGTSLSITTAASGNQSNPFFQSLGTNGRSCASCHDSKDGWSLQPASLQARFNSSQGTDPVFQPIDGANSPNADVSTPAAKQQAYSLLLQKGLIRTHLPMPASAEFTLDSVDDPYGYASAAELSLYRRPSPTTNLKFLADVMWDARETVGDDLVAGLKKQALDATMIHAQASTPPSDDQITQIVDFELSLFSAQATDSQAGDLTKSGGGPVALSSQPFHVGINNPIITDPGCSSCSFTQDAMTLFSAWEKSTKKLSAAQASIGRGEQLFNNVNLTITGVRGYNDKFNEPTVTAPCTACHHAPNSGGASIHYLLGHGVGDSGNRTADLPLYTFRCTATNDTYATNDPGLGLITGKCADLGLRKVPVLRNLAARAPYFHDGSAATLEDVVNFYNQRFSAQFTAQQTADMVAFLETL